MPHLVKPLALLVVSLVLCLLLWWAAQDILAPLGEWAAGHQRAFQNQIARSLRALRAAEPGALSVLMLVCFSYGFFHAIGPGHGKILIGGYGMARAIPWARLGLLALVSSLGQAVTAVGLVYGAIMLLQLGRDSMIGIAEDTMAPVSYAAITGIGLWLLLRGLRKMFRRAESADGAGDPQPQPPAGQHAHVGHQGCSHVPSSADTAAQPCADCGHHHGPSLAEVEALSGWREALLLIASIAVRPCTGALFVLIITWQMGIALAGIAGAFAMALGTASVTIAVGLAALGLRGSALALFTRAGRAAQVVPVLEVGAGFLIALAAAGLLVQSLS
ncbi:nickel/cobalt transporter [Pseudophaeobacter flagellatus]|uniref:nickel/cobalt transporter n=1 Tax=Pseudophaeobacter flagellatus TaxID=2899119 RepID=UPI001E5A52CD|nr:hypothetical protein [Pseudophaeobacter flagellatus]MCD9147642.1 hypothetical protein [Pseudophaeobacter flagellatus]